MISPGATLGLLGGGQLGRMFAIAARRMGYKVHTFEPVPESPAGQISDLEVNAPWGDRIALEKFAAGCDVITYEFENIPVDVLHHVTRTTPALPDASILHICQNREREKTFLRDHDYPHAPFAVVRSAEDLGKAFDHIGFPSVLKTADFGYDGKGQLKLQKRTDAGKIWQLFGMPSGVLEGWVDFKCEISVVCARTSGGEVRTFPVSENIHTNHILDFSIVPARIPDEIRKQAEKLAAGLADSLKVTGLLAVEMFLTRDGKLLVNELAPRPHNSGHYTFDACITSQFEQQLRAVCGLPLGSTELLSPVVMVNLLGDLWKKGEPAFERLLQDPLVKLHLYGKAKARPGRKMGHFCVLGADVNECYKRAQELKKKLLILDYLKTTAANNGAG